jgi:cysteine synthase
LKLAHARPNLRRIVTVLSDNGLRYLSTELCGAPKALDVPERAHPADEADRRKIQAHPLAVIR